MSVRRVSAVDGVAAPVGAFSHAAIAHGFVFTSGQIPARPDGTMPLDFEDQLRTTLHNLRTVLRAAGSDLDHVVKVNGYVTDPTVLDTYNRVYAELFGDDVPARTTVCVTLWGVALELDCVAAIAGDAS